MLNKLNEVMFIGNVLNAMLKKSKIKNATKKN